MICNHTGKFVSDAFLTGKEIAGNQAKFTGTV